MENIKNIASPVSSASGVSPQVLMIKATGDAPLYQIMKEIWKDIPGYEGYYQVSSFGNVKRLPTILLMKNGRIRPTKGRILKKSFYTNGYGKTTLCRNSKKEQIITHRLVGLAFVPNPLNLPEINHLDEIKSNNLANNLEWTTHKQNVNYGTNLSRRSATVVANKTFAGANNFCFGKFGTEHPASKNYIKPI
jgi:hypothetical protein